MSKMTENPEFLYGDELGDDAPWLEATSECQALRAFVYNTYNGEPPDRITVYKYRRRDVDKRRFHIMNWWLDELDNRHLCDEDFRTFPDIWMLRAEREMIADIHSEYMPAVYDYYSHRSIDVIKFLESHPECKFYDECVRNIEKEI